MNKMSIIIFIFCTVITSITQAFNLNRSDTEVSSMGKDYEIPTDPKYIPWPKTIVTYAIQEPITSDVTLSVLRRVVREGFDIWSKYIPRDFIETIDLQSADIKLGFWSKYHYDNISFDGIGGIVAHASYKGILHYDRNEKWKRYSIGGKEESGVKDLLAVTIHEIGHVLGIGHLDSPGSIMKLDYQGDFDLNGYVFPNLLPTDIQYIQSIYGARDPTIKLSSKTISNQWNKRNISYAISSVPSTMQNINVNMLISKAFSSWSKIIPMDFYQISEINSSDIRIRFVEGEHGDNGPFTNGTSVAHLIITDDHKNFEIHFDSDNKWGQNIVGKPISQNSTDFYTIALKMTGAALGLENNLNPESIMYYLYKQFVDENENYVEPKISQIDIKAIQKIYGPGF